MPRAGRAAGNRREYAYAYLEWHLRCPGEVTAVQPARLIPTALVILLLGGAATGCAHLGRCDTVGCADDARLAGAVRDSFSAHPALLPPNLVRVEVTDHVVYLYGLVNTETERLLATDVARRTPGVTKVVNSISTNYAGR